MGFDQALLGALEHEVQAVEVIQAAAPTECAPKLTLDELPHHLPVPVRQLDPGGSWRRLDGGFQCGLLLAVEGGGSRRCAQSPDRPGRPAERYSTIPRSCAGHAPTHPPPARLTNLWPAATRRASAPAPATWELGTSAGGPRSGPISIVSRRLRLRSSQDLATCSPQGEPTAMVLRIPPWLWFRLLVRPDSKVTQSDQQHQRVVR